MVSIGAAVGIAWAVSPAIGLVNKKVESYIEKYFQHAGTGEHFKEMKISLGEIHLIMAKVEKKRIEKHEEVQRVQEIKDAVYEAEDVVKEFEYKLLENEKLMEQQELDSVAITTQPLKKQKLDSAAPSSNFIHSIKSAYHTCTKTGKELRENLDWPILGDGEFKEKVKEVSESLVRAKASAKILLKLMNINTSIYIQSSEQENESPTSSQISEEIIGRIEECERIIKLLFEKKKETPTIIQIEGPGGIGKTTLARLVYNDPRVKESKEEDSFELKMWLSVSENFDGIKLTKEMLKYVSPNFSLSDINFDLLQNELTEKLASKRILLVLDNVWYVKDVNKKSSFEEYWLKFLAPLKKTKPGSKIIVTTREGAVETTMESFGSLEVITLDGLNDAHSWSLLKLKAFSRKNQDNRHSLEPIGEELVKNLNGFPLAIRVVGTELRGKCDIDEWKSILNDNALDKSDIMDILLRSYEHLPDYLQPCFAYCSLFPKGYYLKPDRLVHMWIAQGFVHPRKQKSSEEIGKSYFNELIDRSFIQVIKQENKEYYMMHDLMNDLACHVSHGECHILKEGDTLENLDFVRHLSVTTRELAQLINMRGLDKLRTLILLSDSIDEVNVVDEVFIKMKRIRVLDINCYLDEFPNIEECKLLHYLCFRHCESELAPDTFSKLHLLTVLFIRKGSIFPLALPQSICCMSRLKFIDISKSITMELGGHVQLHSVWRGGPAAFDVKKKQGWELDYLRDFNNIKVGLEIRGLQNVASRKKAIEAQLGSKKHVTKLRLRWDPESSVAKSNIKHNEILEALRPHPNLERLDISQYPGDEFPSWLESNWLSRLTYLGLSGSSSGFKMLPALGQLSQLKRLCFSFINTVSRIGDEFYGSGVFASLEELEINFMSGLEEWSSPRGVCSFPKLRKVELRNCSDLFSLPEIEFFCSLESVVITNCPKIRSLPKLPVLLRSLRVEKLHPDLKQFYSNDIFPFLTELCIRDMKGLEEWSSPHGVHSFPMLRTLKLYECPDLFSLPEMESFCFLESVDIIDCPKIRSLPKLPVSLRSLRIERLYFDLKQFYGNVIFSSLEKLYIRDMKDLGKSSSPFGDHSFPNLRTLVFDDCQDLFSLPELEFFCSLEFLYIMDCPKIRSLPKLPVSLRYLRVERLHPDDLKKFFGNDIFPFLEELYIRGMKGLEEWSSLRGDSFPRLRTLQFWVCPNMFSLPEIESFCSLRSFYIWECPKIRSLPKLPVSLRKLDIKNVHPDLEEQLENKNGPEWDKIAVVLGCFCEIKRAGIWYVLPQTSYETSSHIIFFLNDI